jgi:hypothetical protein
MDDLNFSEPGQTKHIVTPFGQTAWVQDGIAIKPLQSLRARLMKLSDESELDMNPEQCVGLKRRLYGR